VLQQENSPSALQGADLDEPAEEEGVGKGPQHDEDQREGEHPRRLGHRQHEASRQVADLVNKSGLNRS
jgi:hypothetical protein